MISMTISRNRIRTNSSVAQDELGDEYSEDEIRLVRIKFISEMAN